MVAVAGLCLDIMARNAIPPQRAGKIVAFVESHAGRDRAKDRVQA